MDDLWLADDQMPSCDPCMSGRHGDCLDVMHDPRWGLFACGCENAACA